MVILFGGKRALGLRTSGRWRLGTRKSRSLPAVKRERDTARVLVVGIGALGGVLTHELMGAGQTVSVMTHDPDVARVLRISGLRDVRSGTAVLPRVFEPHAIDERFDYVLLTTQPQAIDELAPSLPRLLTPTGRVVCFQNGLCEERVARFVSESRVVGAVVAFGASAHGPGLCERTSTGGLVLGNLDSALDESLEHLAAMLAVLGPTRITTNLTGIRWSKLAVNCAISTLGTIGGQSLGLLLRQRTSRELALAIVREVVLVAGALGVGLERLPGMPPLEWITRLSPGSSMRERLGRVTRHAMALGIGARYRRLRSSMLRAIERGRPPSVDFLNGEVVEHGLRVHVPTPVNRRAWELVWEIARGQVPSSPETLARLHRESLGRRFQPVSTVG